MRSIGIIPDEWVVSYAAGSLSEAHALVVASHIDYHQELQQKLSSAEAIGGALLNESEPQDISDDLWKNIENRLDVAVVNENHASNDNEDQLPRSLAAYLNGGLDELNWRIMGPGLAQVRLWTGPNDERLWLLKAKGGAKIPKHDHRSLEMTLVLQGSYHADDEQFTPGLIELADADTHDHQPIIDEGEDCICLVVTEAPIIIHSLIGRMFQPFIGL